MQKSKFYKYAYIFNTYIDQTSNPGVCVCVVLNTAAYSSPGATPGLLGQGSHPSQILPEWKLSKGCSPHL